MPIYLEPPRPDPKGPDGRGWNRLSLNSHIGAPDRGLCALLPKTWEGLWESRDTRRAKWNPHAYERCRNGSKGACQGCPVLQNAETPSRALRALEVAGPQVPVRIHPSDGTLWVMNRIDGGWAERGEKWIWQDIAALHGWRVGPRSTDEHSEWFWLVQLPLEDGGPT